VSDQAQATTEGPDPADLARSADVIVEQVAYLVALGREGELAATEADRLQRVRDILLEPFAVGKRCQPRNT
jgi:hypothetical protein